jgi:hypothetical protein
MNCGELKDLKVDRYDSYLRVIYAYRCLIKSQRKTSEQSLNRTEFENCVPRLEVGSIVLVFNLFQTKGRTVITKRLAGSVYIL